MQFTLGGEIQVKRENERNVTPYLLQIYPSHRQLYV